MGAGYGYGHRVYVDQARRPQRSGPGLIAERLRPSTVEQCQLHNALNLESQQCPISSLERSQSSLYQQSFQQSITDSVDYRRHVRRTGPRGSRGRGLWIDGRRVSALEWQASLPPVPPTRAFQRWPGRNLQFGFQGPARVSEWSRVAVSLLGTYTVVDVEGYLTGPDATTVTWEFEELDLVLLPSSEPVQ